jgi:hypothetical protein
MNRTKDLNKKVIKKKAKKETKWRWWWVEGRWWRVEVEEDEKLGLEEIIE